MLACLKLTHNTATGPLRLSCLLMACLLLSGPATAQTRNFQVHTVSTRLTADAYLMDSRIELALSEEAEKALKSGIPLIIQLDIVVEKLRNGWWNKTINSHREGYLLLYHALTEKYIVNHLTNGSQADYTSLGASLAAIGTIKDLPLVDTGQLENNALYQIKIRAQLDIESLPAPMRPLAYISSDWQLASDWYKWPLQR